MPSATFFHLPQEKRERFLTAAWAEFTAHSYGEVSINRIIQGASISRGSFYQYFSGKSDLFAYLLKTIYEAVSQSFLAQMTAHGNDFFEAILGMFDQLLWQSAYPREDQLQMRIGRLFRLNADLDFTQFTEQLDLDTMARLTRRLLEHQGCRVEEGQERAVLHCLLSMGLTNLVGALRCGDQQTMFREQLQVQLAILRRGLRPAN